jgi:hypothetical protein
MKKTLLLFLLGFNFCFSQDAIEIRLVNSNIGAVDLYSTFPIYSQSTDNNMNTILQNHNVINYEYKNGHPIASFEERIIQIICGTCNYTNLLNDLLAYNTVVESGQFTNQYGAFSDAAFSKLVDVSIGIPTGINSNNIITTNDIGLNQIFINHNVIHYQQVSSNSTNPEVLKIYTIACNCNANLLRNDLDAYSNVINYTEPMPASYLLNSQHFNKKDIKIYPNPFKDAITIETDLTINNYIVFDLIGKKIIETKTAEILNSELKKLNSGTYLLQLQTEDGSLLSKKLIKN